MTIEDRLREAASEAKAVIAQVPVPEALRARPPARWRGPVIAFATAAVVLLAVAGTSALLRAGGSGPTTVAPAAPAPIDETPQVDLPAGALEVRITEADPERVEQARQHVIETGGRAIVVVGQVGDNVLVSYDGDEASGCLSVVERDGSSSGACSATPPGLHPGNSLSPRLDDTGFRLVGHSAGRLAPEVALVVVTVGETVYAQRPLGGIVYLPYEVPPGGSARIEAFAEDGRLLSVGHVDGHVDLILDLLDQRVLQEAVFLAERGGFVAADVEALERRLAMLRDAAQAARAAGGAGDSGEVGARLAAAEAQVALLRARLRPPAPDQANG